MSCQQIRDQQATPPAGYARTARTDGARRPSRFAPSDVAAARSFYGDVLRGQQVWATDDDSPDATLWFLVGGTLVEVCGAPGAERPPVVLAVDAPDELAARCWDAGFVVRVHDDALGRSVLSVLDPFGRELVLARRGSPVRPRRPSAPAISRSREMTERATAR